MKKAILALSLIAIPLFLSCAHPPMDMVEKLREEATANPDNEELQLRLEQVLNELRFQDSKFALFRSYTKTKELISGDIQLMSNAPDHNLEGWGGERIGRFTVRIVDEKFHTVCYATTSGSAISCLSY